MYAARIKKGFRRLGLFLGALFVCGAVVAIAVAIYQALEPLLDPSDIQITLADKSVAEFPARTSLEKIEAAIRQHYQKDATPNSKEKNPFVDELVRRAMLDAYPQYRRTLFWREEVWTALLAALGLVVSGGLTYVLARTVGWVLAGFVGD